MEKAWVQLPADATYVEVHMILLLTLFLGCSDKVDEQQQHQERVELRRKQQRAFEKSPQGQLQNVKRKKVEVQKKINDELQKLLTKFTKESHHLNRVFAQKLKSSPLKSHQELLEKKADFKELYNYLERLSILEYNTQWLRTNLKKAEDSVLDLEQAEWKLEHFIEMSKVTSEEELEMISKAILTANITLDKEIPTPQRQDLASIQQKIFNDVR